MIFKFLRKNRKNIYFLSLVSLIAGAYWSMIFPVYQPLILSFGLSMSMLRILEVLTGRIGILLHLLAIYLKNIQILIAGSFLLALSWLSTPA